MGLRAELLKNKTGGGTFPNALCERDLVDEALSEGTFETTADNITRLRHRRSRIHVVNRRSNVVHAVDLDSMASPTSWWSQAGGWRFGWSAACGWKFGSADVRMQAGGSVARFCSGQSYSGQVRLGPNFCFFQFLAIFWGCVVVVCCVLCVVCCVLCVVVAQTLKPQTLNLKP